jgi:hypothetical protein
LGSGDLQAPERQGHIPQFQPTTYPNVETTNLQPSESKSHTPLELLATIFPNLESAVLQEALRTHGNDLTGAALTLSEQSDRDSQGILDGIYNDDREEGEGEGERQGNEKEEKKGEEKVEIKKKEVEGKIVKHGQPTTKSTATPPPNTKPNPKLKNNPAPKPTNFSSEEQVWKLTEKKKKETKANAKQKIGKRKQ